MNRRLFLTRLCSLTTTLAVYGVSGLALSGCSFSEEKRQSLAPAQIPVGLGLQLAHLADADFSEYAGQYVKLELYTSLLAADIFSETGEYQQGRLEHVMRREPMLEYRGFYYTESELQLYALSYLLRQETVQMGDRRVAEQLPVL